MSDKHIERDTPEDNAGVRPSHPLRNNPQQGSDDGESMVADNDLAMRGAGPAGESAGSGVPGLGGSAGGTSSSGGVGLPGGNRKLGTGRATSSDAGLGGTMATGGLGTGDNARSGRGHTPSTEVLSGGATRPANRGPEHNPHAPTPEEDATLKRADQGALQSGAMMNDRPGSAAGNDSPTHGDEAATHMRKSRIAKSKPLHTEEDTPVQDAPQYDADTPTWSAGSRSTSQNPVPEQPAPGLVDHPGPEAET